MERIPVEDRIEMVLIYGECGRNMGAAVAMYAERFPRIPRSRASFYRVIQSFRTNGTVKSEKRHRIRHVANEDNQIAVLAAVDQNPHVSTRDIARDSGISQSSVVQILKLQKFHPYHIHLHQELHGNDFQNRITFCRWALQRIHADRNFFAHVLFSDEATFTNHGSVNRHNMHYWSVENPHWLREVEHQRPWSINVWCGIIGVHLIGPYFIEGTLTGVKYHDFLRDDLPVLLEDLPLEDRQVMWYQHDGCPAHYSRIAREMLDDQFPNRWIGRGSRVNWPARSPDLTPLDFFLWGFLKDRVYQQRPTTRQDMILRIQDVCTQIDGEMLMRTIRSFHERIDQCLAADGHHFEHVRRLFVQIYYVILVSIYLILVSIRLFL